MSIGHEGTGVRKKNNNIRKGGWKEERKKQKKKQKKKRQPRRLTIFAIAPVSWATDGFLFKTMAGRSSFQLSC